MGFFTPQETQPAASPSAEAVLKAELNRLLGRMRNTETLFNMTDDPDLIESYVYQLRAQEARHRYLLREIRRMQGETCRCSAAGQPCAQ